MAMSTSESTLTKEEQALLVESSKRAAAYQAVKDHLEPNYRHIGIGSGSTVVYVVEAIAALGDDLTSKMSFYSTGEQSKGLIRNAGLRLAYIQDTHERLDVAFDGADEVDEDLNLIKGGGAALHQEKLVVLKSKKFICVADFRKIAPRLGTNWKQGIPIEVTQPAVGQVLEAVKALGSPDAKIRSGLPGKAGSIITDNGNFLIDAPFHPLLLPKDHENGVKGGDGQDGLWTVEALAAKLKSIEGVVSVGLFSGKNGFEAETLAQKPVAAYFGMADGSVQLKRSSSS